MAETTTSNARLARQLTLRSAALRIRHTGMPQMVSMSRPVGVNPSSKNRGTTYTSTSRWTDARNVEINRCSPLGPKATITRLMCCSSMSRSRSAP